MIDTINEIKLFKLFVENGVSNHKLLNEVVEMIKECERLATGHSDSEHYDTMVKLMNLENNSGWDGKDKHANKKQIVRVNDFIIRWFRLVNKINSKHHSKTYPILSIYYRASTTN